MTVIQFGQRDLKVNFGMTFGASMLVLSVVWSIFLYNHVISLRHDISARQTTLDAVRVDNIDLKNNLYQVMDSAFSEAFIQESGLVLDKNPQYAQTPSYSALSQANSL